MSSARASCACAGGEEPLDGTAVHPESYAAAGALLTACGCRKKVQKNGSVPGILKAAEEKGFAALSAELAVGEPTLRDIAAELERPGRDLRDDLPQPVLRTGCAVHGGFAGRGWN